MPDILKPRLHPHLTQSTPCNATPLTSQPESPTHTQHAAQYAALAPTPFPILFKLDATGACVELTYDPAELSSRQGEPAGCFLHV